MGDGPPALPVRRRRLRRDVVQLERCAASLEFFIDRERRPRVRRGVSPLIGRKPVAAVAQTRFGPLPVEAEGLLEALAFGVGRALQQSPADVGEAALRRVAL